MTNKLGLPQPIYDAVCNDTYERGADTDISVTQLIDPPRLVALSKLYQEVLEEDASDRIWSLVGQSMHTILERAGVAGSVDGESVGEQTEKRLYATVNGWTISGQFDYIDSDGTLWDWKLASVWEVMNGVKDARTHQLNAYAYLAAVNDIEVKQLRVGFILRDWRKHAARTEAGYPPYQVMVYPIPLWPLGQREAYLQERVVTHQAARITLPECTPEERWAKPDTWAARKPANKRASKVFGSAAEAHAWAKSSPSYIIERRPGVSIRCESYCSVSSVCTQFKGLK
jgi:hypothetical protein